MAICDIMAGMHCSCEVLLWLYCSDLHLEATFLHCSDLRVMLLGQVTLLLSASVSVVA